MNFPSSLPPTALHDPDVGAGVDVEGGVEEGPGACAWCLGDRVGELRGVVVYVGDGDHDHHLPGVGGAAGAEDEVPGVPRDQVPPASLSSLNIFSFTE